MVVCVSSRRIPVGLIIQYYLSTTKVLYIDKNCIMSSMPMPLPISTPIPMPTPHYSEDLLAKELSQLSFKDRNDYQGKYN